MHRRDEAAIVLGQGDDLRLAAARLARADQALQQPGPVGVERFDLVHVDRGGLVGRSAPTPSMSASSSPACAAVHAPDAANSRPGPSAATDSVGLALK